MNMPKSRDIQAQIEKKLDSVRKICYYKNCMNIISTLIQFI